MKNEQWCQSEYNAPYSQMKHATFKQDGSGKERQLGKDNWQEWLTETVTLFPDRDITPQSRRAWFSVNIWLCYLHLKAALWLQKLSWNNIALYAWQYVSPLLPRRLFLLLLVCLFLWGLGKSGCSDQNHPERGFSSQVGTCNAELQWKSPLQNNCFPETAEWQKRLLHLFRGPLFRWGLTVSQEFGEYIKGLHVCSVIFLVLSSKQAPETRFQEFLFTWGFWALPASCGVQLR